MLEAARIELGMKLSWNKVASTRSPPPLKICTVETASWSGRTASDAAGLRLCGEGDWKTAALLRIMKVMSTGRRAAPPLWRTTPITSRKVMIGARLPYAGSLSVDRCGRETDLDVQHLGIGGKDDPARLIFIPKLVRRLSPA